MRANGNQIWVLLVKCAIIIKKSAVKEQKMNLWESKKIIDKRYITLRTKINLKKNHQEAKIRLKLDKCISKMADLLTWYPLCL